MTSIQAEQHSSRTSRPLTSAEVDEVVGASWRVNEVSDGQEQVAGHPAGWSVFGYHQFSAPCIWIIQTSFEEWDLDENGQPYCVDPFGSDVFYRNYDWEQCPTHGAYC